MTEMETAGTVAAPGYSRLLLGGILGLGVALLLGWGACAFWRDAVAPEPERLKQKVNTMMKGLISDHWNAMRRAVEQVGTDEGAKTFFEANPGLAPRIPTVAAFLERARVWRHLLQPLPETLPGIETHELSYLRDTEGAEMSYRTARGTRIFMKWSGDRLVEMRVY